jgi:hypothetical protein
MSSAGRRRRVLTPACAALLCAFPLAAHADDGSSSSDSPSSDSAWQFGKPAGRFNELFQVYGQRIEGLQDVQQRMDGELEFTLGNGTYGFKAVPWGWFRAPDAIGGQPQSIHFYGDFKEAWAERVGSWVDVRAGNQVFGWGTADQINPTDIWNPRDTYDLFFSPKLPIAAVDVKIHPPALDNWGLELIGTPFFRPSPLPINIPGSGVAGFSLDDSRWLLPFPTTVLAGGSTFVAPLQYQMAAATYPTSWQGGARLRVTSLGGWDFSASYANIVESLPRFAFASQGSTASPSLPVVVTMYPSYHREQMIGLDGAGSFTIADSEIGTRFEGAYFIRDNSLVYQAPAALQPDLLRDDYLHVVAGLDYTFKRKILGTVLYLNLQYVYYQRFGNLEQTPGQYVISGLPDVLPWDRDIVFYWEDRVGQNSQLKFQGTLVASVEHGDGMVAPVLLYSWTDDFKTSLGAELFGGSSTGFFGQFGQNSRVNLSATYSF